MCSPSYTQTHTLIHTHTMQHTHLHVGGRTEAHNKSRRLWTKAICINEDDIEIMKGESSLFCATDELSIALYYITINKMLYIIFMKLLQLSAVLILHNNHCP